MIHNVWLSWSALTGREAMSMLDHSGEIGDRIRGQD
jgi:hypothetical protein